VAAGFGLGLVIAMPMRKTTRYVYKNELALPLRDDQRPEDKLLVLHGDLGVSTDGEAALALAIRHLSGFQHTGPKTRAYPSGPLRWHLRSNEKPEGKRHALYSYLGVTTDREAVLALAERHVPGFRRANPLRSGGRRGMTAKHRGLRPDEAYGDEDWMCDIIDMMREKKPRQKLPRIAYDLSCDKPGPGCENPAYGLEPEWIVQRYTNRKSRGRSLRHRGTRILCGCETDAAAGYSRYEVSPTASD
jgi:hypothetical protein